MREVGKVKWFGGFNPKIHKLNDYGYIIRDGKPDLYVNKNHLHCRVKKLQSGVVVTFEVGVNYKNGREQALKVKLLEDEKEDIIKEFIYSNEGQVYKSLIAYQKVKLASKLGDDNLAELWCKLENIEKIFLLFKLSEEKRTLKTLVEKLQEKHLLIRALLIIAWTEDNQDKKEIAYEKVFELMSKYLIHISEDKQELKTAKQILPDAEKFEAGISKQWYEWNILNYLEYYNGHSLKDGTDEENNVITRIVSVIKNMTCVVNSEKETE